MSDIVFAYFPKHDPPSHEQEGERPAVVIGYSNYNYSMFRVVPFTSLFNIKSQRERVLAEEFPEIFPIFPKGVGGLQRDSILLSNQPRSLSSDRIIDCYGSLTAKQYAVVVAALRAANRGSS